MRVVLQRVKHASVHVDGRETGSIGQGFLILLGVSDEDDETIADVIVVNTCCFIHDAKEESIQTILEMAEYKKTGKTNRSLQDVGGEILVVSQFTLYADCRKGNRPSFTGAGAPDHANRLYEYFMEQCKKHVEKVAHGEFGADMKVDLLNDGPFTLMLDSKELFPK